MYFPSQIFWMIDCGLDDFGSWVSLPITKPVHDIDGLLYFVYEITKTGTPFSWAFPLVINKMLITLE